MQEFFELDEFFQRSNLGGIICTNNLIIHIDGNSFSQFFRTFYERGDQAFYIILRSPEQYKLIYDEHQVIGDRFK